MSVGGQRISRWIKDFVDINLGSSDLVAVWETFKFYFRGEFISQRAFRNKLRDKVRVEKVQRIKILEEGHKHVGGQEIWRLLQKEMHDLKMLDVHTVAADVMHANQK